MAGYLDPAQQPVPPFDPNVPDPTRTHRRDGAVAVRLGLAAVDGLGRDTAERIVTARTQAPFRSIPDVITRADLTRRQAEQLATGGAFDPFGHDRRQALWLAGYPGSSDQLDVPIDAAPPHLPGMTGPEITAADLAATRIAPDEHPIAHHRPVLDRHGILPIAAIGRELDRRRVTVAGHVTHRQRPGTASGITFLNLEDETGMLNVVVSVAVWQRYRRTVKGTNTLLIRGIAEWGDGALNLLADKIAPLSAILPAAGIAQTRSRDFR